MEKMNKSYGKDTLSILKGNQKADKTTKKTPTDKSTRPEIAKNMEPYVLCDKKGPIIGDSRRIIMNELREKRLKNWTKDMDPTHGISQVLNNPNNRRILTGKKVHLKNKINLFHKIVTNSLPLNNFLNKVNPEMTKHCAGCKLKGIEVTEDERHFLSECPNAIEINIEFMEEVRSQIAPLLKAPIPEWVTTDTSAASPELIIGDKNILPQTVTDFIKKSKKQKNKRAEKKTWHLNLHFMWKKWKKRNIENAKWKKENNIPLKYTKKKKAETDPNPRTKKGHKAKEKATQTQKNPSPKKRKGTPPSATPSKGRKGNLHPRIKRPKTKTMIDITAEEILETTIIDFLTHKRKRHKKPENNSEETPTQTDPKPERRRDINKNQEPKESQKKKKKAEEEEESTKTKPCS
jgi:hypothetical protein